jgi:hypothetical protein
MRLESLWPLVVFRLHFDNRGMKNLLLALFIFLVLSVTAIALARVCQILAPRVGWPLLVVLSGGGLGYGALFLWQQQGLRTWPLMLAATTLAGGVMSLAGHYFDWRDAVAATETRRAEAIAKDPRLAALIEEQITAPTWQEFMTPTIKVAATWSRWAADAAAKIVLALTILILGKRNGWLAVAGKEESNT